MKKSVYLLSIILILFFAAPFAGCGGGGGGSDTEGLTGENTQPDITNTETEVSALITPSGGTIEVTNSESDMNQAKIIIPPDALKSDTVISLSKVDSVAMPSDIREGGVVIDFSPDGTVFNSNVTITIPYDDSDNDGYVDYTDTLETELKVVYWDSIAQKWTTSDSIISRDIVNNTITFETNHFSRWTVATNCDNASHGPVYIFTIDGLDFDRTTDLISIFFNKDFKSRTAYLYAGILETGIVTRCDCYSFSGNGSDGSWNGDAKKTSELIVGLKYDLQQAKQYADTNKQKFVVLTHSWGTQLGTIGLGKSGVWADLFITLSNPAGSTNVKNSSYNNEYFDPGSPVAVEAAELAVYEFVKKYGVPNYDIKTINAKAWINYWDVGDVFSGPLNNGVEEKEVNDIIETTSNIRNIYRTHAYHAITSLCCEGKEYWNDGDSYWKEEDVAWYGKIFRDNVVKEINSIIPPSSGSSSTTGNIYGILHANSGTGPRLSGATVTCNGKTYETQSDGSFGFWGIPVGTYTISFSKSGYQSYERSIQVKARESNYIGDRWLVADYSDPSSDSTPDLAIHELNISSDDEEDKHSLHLKPGEDFYIWVNIKNRGEVEANKAYNIEYLLSYDTRIEAGDIVLGSETDKEDIESGKTHGNGMHVKAPIKPGVYYIGAHVDSPQDINKLNDYSRGNDERARITVDVIDYTVSGRVVLNGAGLEGVEVTCLGVGSSTSTTNSDGYFTFNNVKNGFYTISMVKDGYSFNPGSVDIKVSNDNIQAQDIIAKEEMQFILTDITCNNQTCDNTNTNLEFIEELQHFNDINEPTLFVVKQGETAIYPVNVLLKNGIADTISLTSSELPKGVSISFSPSSFVPTGSSTATILASSSTEPGMYLITITGTSKYSTKHRHFRLAVVSPDSSSFDFTLSIDPSSVQATPHAREDGSIWIYDAMTHVTLTWTNGEAQLVILKGTGLSFFDALSQIGYYRYDDIVLSSSSPSVTVELDTNILEETAPGTYPFTIEATGGGKTKTQTFNMIIP